MTDSKNPALNSLLQLVGNRNTVTVHRAVVDFLGSLEAAILFEQLLYWHPRSEDGTIAKTDSELMEETCLTRYSLRKSRDELVERGMLNVSVGGFGGSKTTLYTPYMVVINEQWESFVRNQTNDAPIRPDSDDSPSKSLNSDNQSSEIERSNTETTTETTSSERNHDSARAPARRTSDKHMAKLVQMYEMVIGPITPFAAEHLREMADDAERRRQEFPDEMPGTEVPGWQWVQKALEITGKSADRPTLAYTEGIIKRWKKHGLESRPDGRTESDMTPEEHEKWLRIKREKARRQIDEGRKR